MDHSKYIQQTWNLWRETFPSNIDIRNIRRSTIVFTFWSRSISGEEFSFWSKYLWIIRLAVKLLRALFPLGFRTYIIKGRSTAFNKVYECEKYNWAIMCVNTILEHIQEVGPSQLTSTRTVLCIINVNCNPIEWILKQFCDIITS